MTYITIAISWYNRKKNFFAGSSFPFFSSLRVTDFSQILPSGNALAVASLEQGTAACDSHPVISGACRRADFDIAQLAEK